VTPVVGFVDDLENQIEKRRVSPEIEEVFSVSLEDLSNPKAIEWEDLNRGRLPYFTSGKHRIWGLTAYILYHFLTEILHYDLPKK